MPLLVDSKLVTRPPLSVIPIICINDLFYLPGRAELCVPAGLPPELQGPGVHLHPGPQSHQNQSALGWFRRQVTVMVNLKTII
jgi:hypothetical protein